MPLPPHDINQNLGNSGNSNPVNPSFGERKLYSKPEVPVSESIKSVKRSDFERHFKSYETRQEVAKGLGLALSSPKVTEALNEMKKELDINLGAVIDEGEQRSLGSSPKLQERYYEERDELRKLQEGGLTAPELKKIRTDRFKRDYVPDLIEKLGKGKK